MTGVSRLFPVEQPVELGVFSDGRYWAASNDKGAKQYGADRYGNDSSLHSMLETYILGIDISHNSADDRICGSRMTGQLSGSDGGRSAVRNNMARDYVLEMNGFWSIHCGAQLTSWCIPTCPIFERLR